jgi:hypothetical protein
MSEEAGIIYILSNPAMPGLVKLGKTTNLPARLKQLYSTGVPVPFHCVFAKRVDNYHQVERKLHAGLRSHRENENREFFRIAEEEVINFLELIPGEEVTPKEDVFETPEDQAAFEKTSSIEHRFNFDFVEIPRGAVLEFLRDSSYTCIVKSKHKVEYEGEEHSLSSAGVKIMNEHLGFSWKTLAGPLNWKYEGEVLKQRQQRFEEAE